jgi:hypothetical protein
MERGRSSMIGIEIVSKPSNSELGLRSELLSTIMGDRAI